MTLNRHRALDQVARKLPRPSTTATAEEFACAVGELLRRASQTLDYGLDHGLHSAAPADARTRLFLTEARSAGSWLVQHLDGLLTEVVGYLADHLTPGGDLEQQVPAVVDRWLLRTQQSHRLEPDPRARLAEALVVLTLRHARQERP